MKNAKKILGENIKKYRHIYNISQEKLAENCDLHRTYITSIEAGNRNVSIENIQKIALALNIKITSLLEGIDD